MIPMIRRLVVCACLLLLCYPVSARTMPAPPDFRGKCAITSYDFTTFDGKTYPAEIGTLSVPENRSQRSSRLIHLAFVRLKSTSARPAAPLVFLAGGPGSPGIGMARVPIYFRLFDRLRTVADVILLDQRGTGLSSPNLRAPDLGAPPPDVFETEEKWLREMRRQTVACARYWRTRGVDLSGYNTIESAEDVEELRRALGANKITLLGHSYGTELALAVIRRHGDHVERLILAGMHGPDNLLALARVWDMLIRKVGYLAANDPAIRADVPDLEALFRRVLVRLEKKPVPITITDARSRQPRTIRVGGIGLRWLVRMDMTDARTFAELPALLYAMDHGDYSRFARRIEPLFNAGLGRSAMAWAVDFSSGWSADRKLRAEREAKGALLGNVNIPWNDGIRADIGVPDRGKEIRARVWSVLPTLFISGTLDPNTPPFEAEEVRWGFPNSVHLVVENGGHESLLATEVQDVMLAFLTGKEVHGRGVSVPPPAFVAVKTVPQ